MSELVKPKRPPKRLEDHVKPSNASAELVPEDVPTTEPMPEADGVIVRTEGSVPAAADDAPTVHEDTPAKAESDAKRKRAAAKEDRIVPARSETPEDVERELEEYLAKVRLLSSRNKEEMPAVCKILRGNHFYYLTMPQVPNQVISDCWYIARGKISGERCIALMVSILGITPPRLYSSYEFQDLT